jgi:hypothetical protein
METRQDWTMYETHDDGEPKLWQIRESFPDGVTAATHPTAIVVEWRYGDRGLPDAALLSRMHAFERLLGRLDTDGGNSVLVHIIRGRGLSELCWYARDRDVFMEGLNHALAGQPRYPIAIEFLDDPAWKYRRAIVAKLAPPA